MNCTAEFLYEEKKSKFLAFHFDIKKREEIDQVLKQLALEHKHATHVCYAVVFSGEEYVCKCSDDGEPSGTAGRPILNVLEKQNKRGLVVVVRYFGGTKLGAGGLVRAYTKAAAGVLKEVKNAD